MILTFAFDGSMLQSVYLNIQYPYNYMILGRFLNIAFGYDIVGKWESKILITSTRKNDTAHDGSIKCLFTLNITFKSCDASPLPLVRPGRICFG